MRLLATATALTAAILFATSVAVAADVGANDDAAKHAPDGGVAMYGDMAALGLRQIVIGVRFVPSQPLVIQDKEQLDRTIPTALDAGLRVVLAVYPYPTREIEARMTSPSLFASYVGVLASIYPQVKQFVIGNEPNQPAFWRPQFFPSGANASARLFGPYLAAAYDTLKAVDPAITVVGVGLSPRGNDRPKARTNISTSPVRFLRALGAWYRKSGRTQPLMDGFSFHPYPNRATDSLDRGYSWPNAGFANLDRIKQALWDAFQGTPQPTTLEGLKIHLDEVGWQVDTSGLEGYTGAENVPVTDELTQATIYGELIRRAACDPDIAAVSFFGFRDDGLRSGFQAALQRLDGSARPAAAIVQTAIADAAAGCTGAAVEWIPEFDVIGARVALGAQTSAAIEARIAVGEDARARLCIASATASGPEEQCRNAALRGLRTSKVVVRVPKDTGRRVAVTITLSADANRTRQTIVVRRAVLRR